MERDAALSRSLDVHGLDSLTALERSRDAIEALPAGGDVSILTGDETLGEALRALCTEKGFDLLDVSEPATMCFLVYRPF